MQNTILIALLLSLLAGCVHQHRVSSGLALSAYDGVSQDYPDDGQVLADQAADALAQKIPPGGTTLALVQTDTYFGSDFENALRSRGFAVSAPATPESPGIQVAYTLDVVQETTPPICYLQVTTSDGVGFGTTRRLGPKSTRQKPTPSQPLDAPEAAPESYTLPDATPQAPAMSPGQTQSPTEQAPAQPSASPVLEPVQVPAGTAVAPAPVPVAEPLPPSSMPPATQAATAKVTPVEVATPTSSAVTPAPVDQGTQSHTQSQSPYLNKEVPAMSPGQTRSPTEQAPAQPSASPAPEPVQVPLETTPVETWGIEPGSLLTQLEDWTTRAQYKLIWNAKHDYEMSAASQFHCNFVEAVKKLFHGLHNSGHALRVTVYQGNHVLEVAED